MAAARQVKLGRVGLSTLLATVVVLGWPAFSGLPDGAGISGLAILAGPARCAAQGLPVEEHVLNNGMRLLLYPRHDQPSVSCGWVAHVGSADEPPGQTGISHLIEHLLFKGTTTLNIRPGQVQKEAALLAQEDQIQQQIRAAEARLRQALGLTRDELIPEKARPATLQDLDARFAALTAQHQKLLVANEFHQIYYAAGALDLNAHTTVNMTTYTVSVPSNKLELWFWMESERLLHPVFRGLYPERDVVLEERRQRIESTPIGKQEEAFRSAFWQQSPYRNPVSGWPAELSSLSRPEVEAYFHRHYVPQNLTAVLVGDFDPATALRWARRYFERLPKGPPPRLQRAVPLSRGQRRERYRAETNPHLSVYVHTSGAGSPDAPALQVAAQLLDGRGGRLFRAIVPRLGSKVEARQVSHRLDGLLAIEADCPPSNSIDDVEEAVGAQLDRLASEAVPAEELTQAKNLVLFGHLRQLGGNQEILQELLDADGLGDWRQVNLRQRRIEAVTPRDVLRVARRYFGKERRAVAVYSRTEPGR